MSAMKKGLGRGFESLIPTDLLDDSFDPTASQDDQVSHLKELPLAAIQPDPEQPRRVFEEAALEELADSIRQHGVLQPIIVTPKGDGYQIIAGERRYRASLLAGLDKIPALVRTASAQNKLEVSLIENLQRENLNPIETATAYQKLHDQFNMTLEEIGKRVGGKSLSSISNTFRLLKLPKFAKTALAEGKLTEGQARPLVNLDEKIVAELLPRIIDEGWSARQVERYVSNAKKQLEKSPKVRPFADHRYEQHIERFRTRLGEGVKIQSLAKGEAGRIIIPFKNMKELEQIEKEFLD